MLHFHETETAVRAGTSPKFPPRIIGRPGGSLCPVPRVRSADMRGSHRQATTPTPQPAYRPDTFSSRGRVGTIGSPHRCEVASSQGQRVDGSHGRAAEQQAANAESRLLHPIPPATPPESLPFLSTIGSLRLDGDGSGGMVNR
jgi:hypothetical protein